MNNTILLIGNHPLCESIKAQYEALGCGIEMADTIEKAKSKDYNELCILPQKETADHEVLQALETFAMGYPEAPEGQSKPLCHLLLHDKVTLWLLQTLDLYPEIHKKFELYAFTMEDQWAKNVLCGLGKRAVYPPLDREKIDTASNKTVHLVIAGFSDLGESMALHAALIAHFPNYVRNQTLRTRITIVDKAMTAKKRRLHPTLLQPFRTLLLPLHRPETTQHDTIPRATLPFLTRRLRGHGMGIRGRRLLRSIASTETTAMG